MKKSIKGFTLVEALVYIAVFFFLSGVVIYSYTITINSYKQIFAQRNLMNNGSKTLERIAREVRKAESIDSANSTFGTNPGVLELDSASRSVRFLVSGNSINFVENGTTIGNMLSSSITPTSLIFRKITTTNGEGVKIEMQLSTQVKNTTMTESFYQTVLLRGKY